MYGKIMSIPDTMIEKYFQFAADSSSSTMKKMKANLDNSEINPRDLKRDLARKIIELFYNRQSAVKGEKYFDKIFIKKGVPEDIVNISIKEKTLLIDCLLENNLL